MSAARRSASRSVFVAMRHLRRRGGRALMLTAPCSGRVMASALTRCRTEERWVPSTRTRSRRSSARPRRSACPNPRTVSYVDVGRTPEFDATCEGDAKFNGFYGHGIVDAYGAVTRGGQFL
jgi:hypothetical protein